MIAETKLGTENEDTIKVVKNEDGTFNIECDNGDYLTFESVTLDQIIALRATLDIVARGNRVEA